MLSEEALEQYRKMTPGERLQLIMEMIRGDSGSARRPPRPGRPPV